MFAADEHANMILFLHWGISPEIFHLGGFGLRYYSIGFLLAFTASYMVLLQVFRQERWSRDTLDRLLVYVIAGTLIGARLGHCFFYDWTWYKEHPWEIILPFTFSGGEFVFTGYQGLASHGAAIGILTAAALFSDRRRVPLIWLLDRLALVVPLAGAFIRSGNFFNSEIIGRPTHLPWAVIFTRVDNMPRHPAQLDEALAYLLIFALLWRLYRRHAAPGKLFGYMLIGVFSARFGIEFVKENQAAFENGHLLNMGQLLSLPLIAVGIYFLNFYKRKYGDS